MLRYVRLAVRRLRSRSTDSTAEIIATVSHEIRSPLTTIKGFTKTLIDRWDRLSDEAKLDMLRAVNADADRVTRIITELLDVSRLESGRLKLHMVPVDMRELAADIVETLAHRSETHSVALEPGQPLEVRADPDKLRQVLTNFIENAQKYTNKGTITVRCDIDGEWGMISVTDEGEGIPPRQWSTVFEKFARTEVAGAPTGTGLGLYISKGLVEAHKGEIGVTSSEGQGSTFWFRLPAIEDES